MNTTDIAYTTLGGTANITWDYDVTTLPSDVFNATCSSNCSTNATIEPTKITYPYSLWQSIIIIILLALLIIGTMMGNVLVCTAVAIVRKLRTPSNLLIVSLAVSDLLVSLVVMPFAASYELTGRWVLGRAVCDMWTSMDVLVCTASILNLFMISIDRYFVITRPFQYAMKRTPKRMALMITCAWLSAALISIPPLFGWRPESHEGECGYSQAVGYQFYATIGSFYLPVSIMIFIYYRIYMVSSRIAHAEAKSKPIGGDLYDHNNRKASEENHNCPNGSANKRSDESTHEMLPKKDKHHFTIFKKSRLNRISSSKERKATKTLGVIMGAFTACWLPFFILAPIQPFCSGDCHIPRWLSSLFLWLGYANSFLNPIIYARFNREFRTPFREIILCRCRGINMRLRSESYAEQFGGAPGPATLRDCIRPPVDTVVRYHSQRQTIVKLGNGEAAGDGKEEAKL